MLPNKHNLNNNNLTLPEDNMNDVVEYQVETIDFPDSPLHNSFLEITEIQEKSENDEEFNMRKKINISAPSSPFQEKKNCDSEENISNEIEDVDLNELEEVQDAAVNLSLETNKKKISINCETFEDERSISSLSSRSNADIYQSDDVVLDEDDRETLDELDEFSDSSLSSDHIPEMSAVEELEEERSWKSCIVNGEDRKIDMKVIEPYRKVISHGGYEESSCNAIILFAACYLPDRSCKDYDYIMDNLFLYVVVTLDELIAEDYVLIYLHGATESSSMPSFSWLKRCYQMIDRRLRKNLKKLYLVHPTFWLKTIAIMTRPFISAKFSRKLKFIYSLRELSTFVPLKHCSIPDKVKKFDFKKTWQEYVNKNRNAYQILYNTYTKSY